VVVGLLRSLRSGDDASSGPGRAFQDHAYGSAGHAAHRTNRVCTSPQTRWHFGLNNVAYATVALPSVDESRWMNLALQCDYATFFHTPMWQRAVLDAYPGYRAATFEAELPSGTIAIFPLLEVRRAVKGIASIYASTFAGCYGGPIASGLVIPADNARLQDLLCGWNRLQIQVTGNPLAPDWAPPRAFRLSSDFTHILSLSSDATRVSRGFARRYRETIAKARREGVVAQPSWALSDWRRYFAVYQGALAHWGEHATNNYPWRLFYSLFQIAQAYPQHIKLWVARKDGDVIAGALIFYFNNHAVYWHGASDRGHERLSPAKLLLASAVEHACVEGYCYFDFSPSSGHAGTATFKSRFGAQPRPVSRFQLVRAPLRGARYLNKRIPRPEYPHILGAVPAAGSQGRSFESFG
jgi:hypothetical protein